MLDGEQSWCNAATQRPGDCQGAEPTLRVEQAELLCEQRVMSMTGGVSNKDINQDNGCCVTAPSASSSRESVYEFLVVW